MMHLPYILNIVIFAPVCWMMYSVLSRSDGFKRHAAGAREMAIALTGIGVIILIASVAGLFWPRALIPLLVIQVLYKALFLVLVALPLWRSGGISAIPKSLIVFFIFVVVTYPVAIWAIWAEWELL